MNDTRPTIIPAQDAHLQFWPDALSRQVALNRFQTLFSTTPWRQHSINLFGRTVPIPRLQAWYGDSQCSYSYSSIALIPLPWTHELIQLKEHVETLCSHTFNSVLLNLYRTGQDSNGWHSDDEKELGQQPVIASLSLGATRRFKLCHKIKKEQPIINLELTSGSLLCMSGHSQSHWQHCVPKTARLVEPRINLTFRNILNGPH